MFLLSAGILGYEVLLTRFFSIIQWHHYAYMIVSLALLGFGVSGAFLTVFGASLVNRFASVYAGFSLLFGITVVAGVVAAQCVPLDALSLVWDPTQGLWLALIYFILMVPFFFAASCLGLVFMRFTASIHSLYAVDLIGAGMGCCCRSDWAAAGGRRRDRAIDCLGSGGSRVGDLSVASAGSQGPLGKSGDCRGAPGRVASG